MKKSFFIFALTLTLFSGHAAASPLDHTSQPLFSTTPAMSNVGDDLPYAYKITKIQNGEVHGIPLNRSSETNRGIFLYNEEIPFDVQVGDKIVVIWGKYEDEFKSITPAVLMEDGSYTINAFYE